VTPSLPPHPPRSIHHKRLHRQGRRHGHPQCPLCGAGGRQPSLWEVRQQEEPGAQRGAASSPAVQV
uniref:Uncharacterized protein n=1 Tax=Coturnix japonica TaxID=93934 RepID=A0A8C2SKR1_COTJA